MDIQKELEILDYLKENPAAPDQYRRVWLPSGAYKNQTQFDTFLPMGIQNGEHLTTLQEIADYLRDKLGITQVPTSKQVAPKKFAGHAVIDEDIARDPNFFPPAGLAHMPYQFFFDNQDAQDIRAHVAARLAQLGQAPAPGSWQAAVSRQQPGQSPPPPNGPTP